jgi:WD40 repeat protein
MILAPEEDSGWSPDGTRIIFSGVVNDDSSEIHLLDVENHRVSNLPASRGLFSPRWSPDERYIAALTSDTLSIRLFDFKTGEWSELLRTPLGFPSGQKMASICISAHTQRSSRPPDSDQ